MMRIDDFSKDTKLVLAQRAGYKCSVCKGQTVGPHSDSEKSLSKGIAAHICAAESGGPRYDIQQTSHERRSIENAIWVCHNCSDLIDKDPGKFPKELLFEIKKQHEQFVLDELLSPVLSRDLNNINSSIELSTFTWINRIYLEGVVARIGRSASIC